MIIQGARESLNNASAHAAQQMARALALLRKPGVSYKGPSFILPSYTARLVQTKITTERGVITKENWMVQNLTVNDGFNHLLVHKFHPGKVNSAKPVVVLVPGMLCNGNLFNLFPDGTDFKNLNSTDSLANRLAALGHHVVIIHPRGSQWIFNRYAKEKLGVGNRFSKKVVFAELVNDLHFYIELALHLTGVESAVVLGYSKGGKELLSLLGSKPIDPRIIKTIFLGAPVEYSENKAALIGAFRRYTEIAHWIPFKSSFSPLGSIAWRANAIRHLAQKAPDTWLMKQVEQHLDLGSQLYNPNHMNAQLLIDLALHVLEPLAPQNIKELLENIYQGDIVENGDRVLDRLPQQKHLPQSLAIDGGVDGLVSPSSHEKLVTALGPKCTGVFLPDFGHIDLAIGTNMAPVHEPIVEFLAT